MDDASRSLTNEWVSKKIKFSNQFKVVNHLIKLAESKVHRGVEEINSRNLAVEVIHDVASGRSELHDIGEKVEKSAYTEISDDVNGKTL